MCMVLRSVANSIPRADRETEGRWRVCRHLTGTTHRPPCSAAAISQAPPTSGFLPPTCASNVKLTSVKLHKLVGSSTFQYHDPMKIVSTTFRKPFMNPPPKTSSPLPNSKADPSRSRAFPFRLPRRRRRVWARSRPRRSARQLGGVPIRSLRR